MPAYVVQASPLTKLFMSEWAQRIEQNPDIVFEPVDFEIRVPRPFGGLIFQHNKPVRSTNVIPHSPNRKKTNDNVIDDLEGTIFWLTGGPDGQRSEETDIYGIVALHIDFDVSTALTDISLFADSDTEVSRKKAADSYKEMQRTLVKQTGDAMKAAKELADFRVRRALRITHHNLMKQYETLRSDGKGVYSPSLAEAVGAHIIASEIEQGGENRRKMLQRLNEVMQKTTVLQ